MEVALYALQEYFQRILSFETFGLNILDIVIFVIILFYAYEGYMLGFLYAFLDLSSFVVSFLLALTFYTPVGEAFTSFLGIPPGLSNALAFFVLALLSEIIISLLLRRVVLFIPVLPKDHFLTRFVTSISHPLGVVPGLASAVIVLSFLLTVIVALPSSPLLKQLVTESRLGGTFVASTSLFEHRLNDVFGGAIQETLNVLTVKPESDETVELHFTVANPTVDPMAEQEMLRLLNEERIERGLEPLTLDKRLQELARDYSRDMFQRGYFSHYNPEGQSPFDRMEIYGISYRYAGENLALAPSVELAHQGLMNSPGHRANILSPNFTKIGIGVMSGGMYGKMFSQEFTD